MPRKCKHCRGAELPPAAKSTTVLERQGYCSQECRSEHATKGKRKKVNRNNAQANRSGKKKNVSNKLRRSAKGRNCSLRLDGCNGDIDTTVLAHLPCGQRGVGMKSPDYMAVFACSHCHDVLDARQKGDVSHKDVMRALAETWAIWIDEGMVKVE